MTAPTLPELPPIPPTDCIPYESIRYVAGYPAQYVREYATAYATLAVMAEREKAAKICDEVFAQLNLPAAYGARKCADAIRNGGTP